VMEDGQGEDKRMGRVGEGKKMGGMVRMGN